MKPVSPELSKQLDELKKQHALFEPAGAEAESPAMASLRLRLKIKISPTLS